MAPNDLIESLAKSFKNLGASAPEVQLQRDLYRQAHFTLRSILDKHNRYAFGQDEEARGTFRVEDTARENDDFVAVVVIAGTNVRTKIRYNESV